MHCSLSFESSGGLPVSVDRERQECIRHGVSNHKYSGEKRNGERSQPWYHEKASQNRQIRQSARGGESPIERREDQ